MLSKKFLFGAGLLVALLILISVVGCFNDSDSQGDIVAPTGEFKEITGTCSELPTELPPGVLLIDIKESLKAREEVAFGMLVPEVLKDISESFDPEEYYIDSIGLHWGRAKYNKAESSLSSCRHPYGFSVVGGLHFVYWFYYRPASYDAYMAWIKIYAQPYGSNGILVQKRDICWICGCNPWCAQLWIRVCAK